VCIYININRIKKEEKKDRKGKTRDEMMIIVVTAVEMHFAVRFTDKRQQNAIIIM